MKELSDLTVSCERWSVSSVSSPSLKRAQGRKAERTPVCRSQSVSSHLGDANNLVKLGNRSSAGLKIVLEALYRVLYDMRKEGVDGIMEPEIRIGGGCVCISLIFIRL